MTSKRVQRRLSAVSWPDSCRVADLSWLRKTLRQTGVFRDIGNNLPLCVSKQSALNDIFVNQPYNPDTRFDYNGSNRESWKKQNLRLSRTILINVRKIPFACYHWLSVLPASGLQFLMRKDFALTRLFNSRPLVGGFPSTQIRLFQRG